MMQPHVGYAKKRDVLRIANRLWDNGSARHAVERHALFAYSHSCIFANLKASFYQTNLICQVRTDSAIVRRHGQASGRSRPHVESKGPLFPFDPAALGGDWSREALLERERVRRRSVRSQVVEPFLRLFDRRLVPSRNPPENEVRFGRRLEPLASAAIHLGMPATVRILEQRLRVLPDREVDEDQRITAHANRGRVALRRLVTPDEPRTAVAELVHPVERGDEVGDQRVVERCHHARDVVLRQVVIDGRFLGHKITLSQRSKQV